MFGKTRVLAVTCLITCLVTIPWTHALASENRDFTTNEALSAPVVPSARADAAFAPVLSQYALLSRTRQSVATTNERKLLLGVVTGALIVGGASLMAYGATSTCKGQHSDAATTNSCDKQAVIGALALSGGIATLVIWSLSR